MIKRKLISLAAKIVALSMILFTVFASSVIFWRSIEIVQSLDYTKWEEYGIVGLVGFMLIWLCSMAVDSAESIIKISKY